MSFGKFLISKAILTENDINKAESTAKPGEEIVDTLIRTHVLDEEKIVTLQSQYYKIPCVFFKNITINQTILNQIPAKFALHYNFVPLDIAKSGRIQIATATPLDIQYIDDIKLVLKNDIETVLAGRIDIQNALKRYYGVGAATVEKMLKDTKDTSRHIHISKTEQVDDRDADASMIKFVNQILVEAYRERATDIHIEPFENELVIRYRIDGILYDTSLPPSIKNFYSGIVSRIKIMSSLNIAEKRAPQDGRMKISVEGNELDLRVSILPTPYGESVNIRLLNASNMTIDMQQLGMMSDDLKTLQKIIKKPYGIILVTGPTGSGKTTTLYSCLNSLNGKDKKIITIEDPIEYLIKGITQIQVHPKIDLTFANGLRSMLRHDPDIMMVGEIRDQETADIAIRIALTGHLVFSTLHTNDSASSITRLIDMGIEPFLISSSVECIIAQRLVRVICPECKTSKQYTKEELLHLGFHTSNQTETIFKGNGCDKCKFTGYQGRTAIHEMLVINNDIRDLIINHVQANTIKEKAITNGMQTLRVNGFKKIIAGITTLEEITRVSED